MLVKYMEKVDASIVVICCSTPVPGKLHIFKVPHAVVFYDDAFRFDFSPGSAGSPGVKSSSFSISSIPVLLRFKSAGSYSFSPSSQRNEQCLPFDLKIRLIQRIRNKFCLSAFQKTINDIYRFHNYPSCIPQACLRYCINQQVEGNPSGLPFSFILIFL